MRAIFITMLLLMAALASCRKQTKMPDGIQAIPAKQVVIQVGMQREKVLELLGLPTLRLMGSNGGKRWVYLDASYDAARLQGVEGAWVIFPVETNQTIIVTFRSDGQVEYVSTR